MKYSVAIAAYNAAETLEDTLDSVLAQTLPPIEVVVVNDGSTDTTQDIAESFGTAVTLISQENQGLARASSTAVKACRSSIIATVDADDLWMPTKMQKQVELLLARPETTVVYSDHQVFLHGKSDAPLESVRSGIIRSCTVFRRALFDQVGDFFETPDNVGDMVDWYARAREQGAKFERVEQVLMLRRIIETSLTYGRSHQGYLLLHAKRSCESAKGKAVQKDEKQPPSFAFRAAHADDEVAFKSAISWFNANPLDDATYTDHRLLTGVFARHASKLRARSEYNKLLGLVRSHWTQTRFMLHEVGPILEEWNKRGLQPVILKGASRMCLDADAVKARIVRDIDLLIPQHQIAEAYESLAMRGWEPADGESLESARSRVAFLRSINLKGGKIADIDLHSCAYKVFNDDPDSDKALWTRIVSGSLNGHKVHVPGPEDRLGIAISHGAWDAGKHSDWLVDASHILRSDDLDWDYFGHIVDARNLGFLAAPVLVFLRDRLGYRVPKAAISSCAKTPMARLAARSSNFLMRADNQGIGLSLARALRARRGIGYVHTALTRGGDSTLPRFIGIMRRGQSRRSDELKTVAHVELDGCSENKDFVFSAELYFDAPPISRRIDLELRGQHGCVAKIRLLHHRR